MTIKELAYILSQVEQDEEPAYAVFDDMHNVDFTEQHDITGVAYNNGRWVITVDFDTKRHF